MARNGPPDDPNNYSDDEPTVYSNYANQGGHDEPPGPPGGEPTPWYRKPVALVAFGALGALLIALVVYGLAKLITGGDSSDTNTPTSLTPLTTASAPVVAPTTTTVTHSTTPTTEPTTTTTTTEPTTTTPTTTTTTTTTPSTSVSTSVSTSTVTETITVPTSPAPPGG